MGIGAGFGTNDTRMILRGTMHDHAANPAVPKPFAFRVRPNEWNEPWCAGLNVFHNPRALHPLEIEVFGGYAQHYQEDGKIKSYLPKFHPYGVQAISFAPDRLKG